MIPYILAENPAMDRRRAFEVTKSLTDGNKGRICFILTFVFRLDNSKLYYIRYRIFVP